MIINKVQIYKNLHKSNIKNSVYSIRKNGLVVSHISYYSLIDCTFHVQEAGRQRVLKEKKKNVHAYIKGEYKKLFLDVSNYIEISYNPYRFNYFYDVETLSPVYKSKYLIINNHQLLASNYDI